MAAGIAEAISHSTVRAVYDSCASRVLNAWDRFFILFNISMPEARISKLIVDALD